MSHAGVWGQHLGALVLCLYTLAGLAATAAHLRQPVEYGVDRFAPGRVIAAAEAGLFWPADLVAAALLAQG